MVVLVTNTYMIKFKEDTTLTIVEEFDALNDNIVSEVEETFKAGELVDAEIIDFQGSNTSAYVDLQFGDGSVALCVCRYSFETEDEFSK